MNVTISLRPETEQNLRKKAARAGMTLETYLEQLASTLFAVDANCPPVHRTSDEWIAEWRDWAASHRVLPALADDDREGIYADRGE
jgi:hypothetical protein